MRGREEIKGGCYLQDLQQRDSLDTDQSLPDHPLDKWHNNQNENSELYDQTIKSN
jgi:hypothetical protein